MSEFVHFFGVLIAIGTKFGVLSSRATIEEVFEGLLYILLFKGFLEMSWLGIDEFFISFCPIRWSTFILELHIKLFFPSPFSFEIYTSIMV